MATKKPSGNKRPAPASAGGDSMQTTLVGKWNDKTKSVVPSRRKPKK